MKSSWAITSRDSLRSKECVKLRRFEASVERCLERPGTRKVIYIEKYICLGGDASESLSTSASRDASRGYLFEQGLALITTHRTARQEAPIEQPSKTLQVDILLPVAVGRLDGRLEKSEMPRDASDASSGIILKRERFQLRRLEKQFLANLFERHLERQNAA